MLQNVFTLGKKKRDLIFMALDLSVWLIIIVAGLIGYFLGMGFKLGFLFIFGSVLLMLSGALLYISDGLVTGYYYDEAGALASIIVPFSNIGLTLLMLVLVAVPIISFLVIDFSPKAKYSPSPFHY